MNGNNITQSLALLIIDMQESIMKVIDSSESLLNRCCFAVEAAQLLNIPVIFTEQAPDKLGPQHFKLNQLASKGSVYSKSYFSSIKASGLLDFLKNQNIEHLLIGGIETPICVYQTVIDALEKDFLVTILNDCTGCRRATEGEVILKFLHHAQCHILPSESVFYSILGGANHPKFRSMTSLVKKYSSIPH